jgi:hypothetical protein
MAETPPFDGSALSSELAEPEKALLVGDFRFYFADELWEWLPEAARIHGHPALEMRPTTDQVMSHKHPDDRAKLAAALDYVRRTHTAISSRHRMIDAQGRARQVVVVSRQLRDDAGNVFGNEGYYVDLTSSAMLLKQEKRDREQWLTGRLGDILAGRIVIEQVKGMLMLIYRLDDRQAFELLRILTNHQHQTSGFRGEAARPLGPTRLRQHTPVAITRRRRAPHSTQTHRARENPVLDATGQSAQTERLSIVWRSILPIAFIPESAASTVPGTDVSQLAITA